MFYDYLNQQSLPYKKAVAKSKIHQFGCGAPASVPVPRHEAFRSGARKGRIARAEEPNGACRSRGKLSLVKLNSTAALRREPTQKNIKLIKLPILSA
jgi:hypothetical protein